jgi:hypothetical protein
MKTRLIPGFPGALSAHVVEVQDRLRSYHPPAGQLTVRVGSEILTIPERLYCKEPVFTQFSGIDRVVAACAFTRNPSGYVRERWLRELLPRREPWVYPYVFALVGDYVGEIVNLIYSQLVLLDASGYRALAEANPAFVELVRQRAISFWDRYQRDFRHARFEQSPAHAILSHFGVTRAARAPAWRPLAAAPLLVRACG